MSDEYAALAPFYDPIGMSAFAESITPDVIRFVQANDWIGRRVVDLGCGTGKAAHWLAKQGGYNTTGIDQSPAMLTQARKLSASAQGIGLTFVEGDIRAISGLLHVELALAFDVFNELATMRDLEQVLQSVVALLDPGKLLVFDLHTIAGLAAQDAINTILHDTERLFVLQTQQFDYDRQSLTQTYRAFAAEARSGTWAHRRAERTLRGFPVPAVLALLTRVGFTLMALVTPDMQPVDPSSRAPRVIVFARTHEA